MNTDRIRLNAIASERAKTDPTPLLFIASAAAIYFTLAAIFTWPAMISPSSTIVGDADVLGGIWWAWARLNGLIDVFHCTKLVAWPEGICGPLPSQPITENLILFFSWITNEIFGSTLFIVFSLVFSALTAFVVLMRRGVTPIAACWGGALIGFNAPALAQILGGHAAYALTVPVILFLDQLEKVWLAASNRSSIKSTQVDDVLRPGLKLGLWLGLTFAVSIYSGYFLSVLVLVVGLGAVIRAMVYPSFARGQKGVGSTSAGISPVWIYGAPFLLSLLIGASIALGCNALLVAHWLDVLPPHVSQTGGFFSRSFTDLAEYGARPLDYLRPFPWHPLWGGFFNVGKLLPPLRGNAYETSLFPGLVVLFAAGAGVVRFRQIGIEDPLRALFSHTLVFTAIMAFLSLSTEISVGGFFDLPVISKFLYPFAPMFRVYARCGIFVAIGLGLLAAISVSWYLNWQVAKLSTVGYQVSLASVMLVGIAELFPSNLGIATSTVNADAPPEVLATHKLPRDSVIVVYPLYPSDSLSHYRHLFWQRIHRKPMLNGILNDAANATLVSEISNPFDQNTREILRSIGVTHIVVDSSFYSPSMIPRNIEQLFPKSALPAITQFQSTTWMDKKTSSVIELTKPEFKYKAEK